MITEPMKREPTVAEELGRFVVVTSKDNFYEFVFFDKQQQSDYVATSIMEVNRDSASLLGYAIYAWQTKGEVIF